MTAGSGEAGVRAEKTLDAALPLPNKKNMQRVFDFLRENSLQYCATVGLDKKPKVRPFQMMYHRGGKLVYCTGAHKDVYAELLCLSLSGNKRFHGGTLASYPRQSRVDRVAAGAAKSDRRKPFGKIHL